MDGDRFDNFVRSFAAKGRSRRSLLGGALSAVAALAAHGAEAGRCGGNGAACGSGSACCPNFYCVNGVCVPPRANPSGGCPAGQQRCAGACVNISADAANCGACGVACPSGEVCIAGQCGCPAGTAFCAGTSQCVSTACAVAGQVYDSASCACVCPGSQQLCNGACVDLSSDVANCGACGTTCTSQPCEQAMCAAGVCGSVPVTGGACVTSTNAPGVCQNGQCACTPKTCATAGVACGSIPDGCGGELDCGACPGGQYCNFNQCHCNFYGGCPSTGCAGLADDPTSICLDGCCCIVDGSTAWTCVPGPSPLCCSGLCGSDGRCAPQPGCVAPCFSTGGK